MNKVKLFLENFFVYGVGGIISKIIPLIMVPIITRLMPNSTYFGINDMLNTIMSFATYFAILGMYDAMYRLFFDSNDVNYRRKVCSTTLMFNVFSSFVVAIFIVILRAELAHFFLTDSKYAYLLIITALTTFVGATNSIIAAPIRMQNRRKIFLVTNTISSLLSYSISVPLLIEGYYLTALPVAGLITSLINSAVFFLLDRRWFKLCFFDYEILKQLFRIGIPLLPNFLIYWIFNSCDKLMIVKYMGIGYSGIYSIGAKLGLASQLIYTAFAGGWQYFAFYTMNEDRQVENNSKVFEYLGIISFVSSFFICVLAEPIYCLLFEEEYHGAFIVSPYLYLAPLIQMLFQVAGNQFLVIKKTWPTMIILSSGAVINVVCNYILIPCIGIEGAAIATLLGYVVATALCVIVLYKMKMITLSKKFYISIILLIGYFVMWRFVFLHRFYLGLMCATLISVLIACLYRNDIIKMLFFRKGKR